MPVIIHYNMYFSVILGKVTHSPLTFSLYMDLELHLPVKLLVKFMEYFTQKTEGTAGPIDQDISLITIR